MAINMSRKERKELGLIELLLIIAAVIGLGIVVWLAWVKPAQHKTTVNSYETCVAGGNPVQETYPEVCVMPDGRHFVNPKQVADQESKAYLLIKEWQAKLPLKATIQDAYYEYNTEDKTIFVSTHGLDNAAGKVKDCKSGLHGLTFGRAKPGDTKKDGGVWTKEELSQQSNAVHEYYFYEVPQIETLCMVSGNDKEVTAVDQAQEAILDAFKHVVAD